ncbi:MAG: hypothetical protein QOJ03_629 [Frankiaceae bacterium]|nr:hypothetical protein [Frankiaceae bacterium]
MPSGKGNGEPFTDGQVREISRACTTASSESGLHYSVYVGPVEGEIRDHAERLHAALGPLASRGVLLLVAPGDRQLEVVTGKESSRRLSDRACALAALSMTTSFSGGDLVGGIVTGLRMLSEASGRELASGRSSR